MALQAPRLFSERAVKSASSNYLDSQTFTQDQNLSQPNSKIQSYIDLVIEHRFSNPNLAKIYADSALALISLDSQKPFEAEIYNQLGIIASVQGDAPTALQYFLDVLRVREDIGDTAGIAKIENNLGILYKNLGELDFSLEFHQRSLETKRSLDDSLGIARSLNNIGEIYHLKENQSVAKDYFQQAMELMITLNFEPGLAAVYNNMAEVHRISGDTRTAIDYHQRSLIIEKKLGDRNGVGYSYMNIASLFNQLGRNNIAISNYENAIAEFEAVQNLSGLMNAYNDLAMTYASIDSFRAALDYSKLHASIKDSLQSIDNQNRIAELRATFNAEKQDQEIALLNEQTALQELKLSQEAKIRNLLILVLVLVVGGLILLYNQIRAKKKLNELLMLQNKQIEDAAEQKAQFLSVLSHEIRTPMNAVVGMTNLLVSENPRADQKQYLDVLSFSSTNLLSIVNDVLEYSKAEADKIELEQIDFPLLPLLTNIYQSFYNQAIKKDVYLRFDHDDRIPEYLIGDPTRLTQVLNNLVSNALKFTQKGSVDVAVKLVDQSDEEARIYFEVKDTGIGVPKDRLDTIFESFSQATKEVHRKYGGTGLGLTITKRLLALHNSEIKVESEVGVGTTFSFEIVYKKGKYDHKKSFDRKELEALEPLQNVSALLVEDNPVNIQVLKIFLSKWGIVPTICENGLEAMRELQKQNFDIILMDLHMPIKDGYETTLEIREKQKDQEKKTPIIALTASNVFEEHKKAYDVGVDTIVPKPFDPVTLYQIIAKYTRSAQHGSTTN